MILMYEVGFSAIQNILNTFFIKKNPPIYLHIWVCMPATTLIIWLEKSFSSA